MRTDRADTGQQEQESPFSDPQLECKDCGSTDPDHVYCVGWMESLRKAIRAMKEEAPR